MKLHKDLAPLHCEEGSDKIELSIFVEKSLLPACIRTMAQNIFLNKKIVCEIIGVQSHKNIGSIVKKG
jgi:hypothetical protein